MINYNDLTKANLYLREDLVGQLEKVSNKKFIFTYSDQWIKSNKGGLGLSLPTDKKKYESEELLPFFDNLIPEGWLLSYAQTFYHVDKKNRFGVLLATGRETVGAVKVFGLDENGNEIKVSDEQKEKARESLTLTEVEFLPANKRCPYCLKELTEKQLQKIYFHQACSKRMWDTTRKIKIYLDSRDPLNSFRQTIYGASISGAQRKGLFNFEKGILSPTYKKSQYIIKPQGDFPYLPENEHVTMAIAQSVGFDIPPFTIFNVENIGMVFAIKRFDLTTNGNQLRLEDFGQVLGIPSSDKYEASYNKIAKAIKMYSDAPIADLFELWKRLLFSFFIGNGDMHLKNWSLIELGSMKGIFKLSPCYDFLNTRLPIHDEEIDLGLTLNGKKHKVTKDLFVNFANENKIGHLIDDVFSDLERWMKTTEDLVTDCYLPEESKERYLEVVKSRFNVLQGNGRSYI